MMKTYSAIAAQFQNLSANFSKVYDQLAHPEHKVLVSQWFRETPVAPVVDDGFLLMESVPPRSEKAPSPSPRTTVFSQRIENETGSFYTNPIDEKSGQPVLIEDFVDRLALADGASVYLQMQPGGRVIAATDLGRNDHARGFDIKLTKLSEGIYNLYARDPERNRWEMLDGERLAKEQACDPTDIDKTPLTRLIKLAFVKEGQSFLESEADFLQFASIVTLTQRTWDYVNAIRNTLKIHRDYRKRIEENAFTAAIGTLIEASYDPNYFDDGSPEIFFVKIVGDVANRLFGDFVQAQPATRFKGHAWTHFEKICRAYTATYVWYTLKLHDHVETTDGLPVAERLANLSRAILAEDIAPFADTEALEKALQIAERHATEPHLPTAAVNELMHLLGVYDFMESI